MGVYWQKLNIDFMIMFSLVYNKIIYRQPVQQIGLSPLCFHSSQELKQTLALEIPFCIFNGHHSQHRGV